MFAATSGNLNRVAELKDRRHKTALKRTSMSRPVSVSLRDQVLSDGDSFFDYGCGYGTDVDLLSANGFAASGWDPFYASENQKRTADIVNLGFVLNVIEDPEERSNVLKEAFALSQKALIVSVRIDQALFNESFGDGSVTRDGAFQKIFTQAEFRAYVEGLLNKKIYIIEPGIGYVFKNELFEKNFRQGRYLNRVSIKQSSIIKKIDHSVDPGRIARLIEELGRIPDQSEIAELGFLGKRKFKDYLDSTIRPLISEAIYEESRNRLRDDVLQAIAMMRIENRAFAAQKDLSQQFQDSVVALFGDYREACKLAEQMLFSLGKDGEVARVARTSTVGKLLPEDLYLHRSALDRAPGLIKLMLSLGESFAGRLDSELLKFSLHGKSMSFLFYPDFETDPHPALHGSVRVDFRTGKTQVRDYSKSENPPILHRKETFVARDFELFDQFEKLSLEEEKADLLSRNGIGFRKQWQQLLLESGVAIHGHDLIKIPTSFR